MSILIRYEGFVTEATDRFYNFSVNGTSDELRQFTVGIPSESFCTAQLKFQDGPAISFQRLREEIDHESLESPAKAQLTISGHNIEDYLVAQHPKKVQKRKRQTSAPAADDFGAPS
jgi:hypothetical protein